MLIFQALAIGRYYLRLMFEASALEALCDGQLTLLTP